MSDVYDDHEFTEDMADHDEAAAEDAAQDRIDHRLPAHSPEDWLITVDGDGRTIARQAVTGDPWTYVRDLRSMPDAELQAQIAESKANTVAQNIAAQDKERHETAARLANNQYPEGA